MNKRIRKKIAKKALLKVGLKFKSDKFGKSVKVKIKGNTLYVDYIYKPKIGLYFIPFNIEIKDLNGND